tara:strand:- start:344 stop:661 length:318 start_codon:yes stop_codon:yes gene_type:complete
MFFNKWKKRAYEGRAENEILQAALDSYRKEVEGLHRTISVMDNNPICKQILDLKEELYTDGKHATRVYLTQKQQLDMYTEVGASGYIETIYGLRILSTQKNMRVE